jgi:predicted O-methyltransferase YrrM
LFSPTDEVMNALLESIYRTGLVQDAQGNSSCPFPISLPQAEGQALYELLLRENLERTLEIGLGNGLSCLFFCQAHEVRGRGQHTAIDPWQSARFKSVGLLNVQRAGLDGRLRFLEGFSHEVLPRLAAQREVIDFAFIDGRHVFDYVLVDFFYIDQLLREGGYLAFDDLELPAIRKVVSFVLRNRAYERVKIDTTGNLPVWRRAARVARMFLSHPLQRFDSWLRFTGQRVGVLRKTSAIDLRRWNSHRSF